MGVGGKDGPIPICYQLGDLSQLGWLLNNVISRSGHQRRGLFYQPD